MLKAEKLAARVLSLAAFFWDGVGDPPHPVEISKVADHPQKIAETMPVTIAKKSNQLNEISLFGYKPYIFFLISWGATS